MTNIPYISVLITAFNVEQYIGRCLRSILDQSMPRSEYEIVVVNDASTDRTRFALELFQNDILLINNHKRCGLPTSLNKGVKKTKGRYIVRLDGDDYVNCEFLKVLSLHLEMNPQIDAIASDYLRVDDHENVICAMNCLEYPIACGIMFRTEQLIDIGLYDEKFLVREDEDLRIRFLKKHKIERVQLPLYRYRQHENNMTKDKKRMDKYRMMLDDKHKKGAKKRDSYSDASRKEPCR